MLFPKEIKSASLAILLILAFPVLIIACSSEENSATIKELPPSNASRTQGTTEIKLSIDLPAGNPENGLNRAVKYRCFGCHVQDDSGLPFKSSEELPSIWERGEIRLADPTYQGFASTNEQYLLESILYADLYLVPGDWELGMPSYFADIMTEQDLADVLAWMETLE